VHCSNFDNGDAAEILYTGKNNGTADFSSECQYGLASAAAVFNRTLNDDESFTIQACCSLDKSSNFLKMISLFLHPILNNLLQKGSCINSG
jgi:hypothetical protein